MQLFWWQHLPLLILVQFLKPFSLIHILQAEALLALYGVSGNSPQLAGVIRRFPCVGHHKYSYCRKVTEVCVGYWSPKYYPPSEKPVLSPLQASTQLHLRSYRSRKLKIATEVGGYSSVPTLTPWQTTEDKKPNKQKLAAIIGGVGAALLVVVTGLVVYFCLMRLKRLIRRASETASSAPSPPAVRDGENIFRSAGGISPYEAHDISLLSISELEHATGNFSLSNIIGEGLFGLVYRGLLDDGSIVAIKRCLHQPVPYFVNQVKHLARIQHKHLVKLIGYCEENHQQFLVYDYLPNGNVADHLYDSEGLPIGKLEMRQRLLIALGAAKGLEHLHSIIPPMLHMHFRTRNVLVDENFISKVSDFGLVKLLAEGPHAESSSSFDCFHDPELRSARDFSDRSDVYSFGVLLLELISGCEAFGRNWNQSEVHENLVFRAKNTHSFESFIDKTAKDHTIHAAKDMMELALVCVDISTRRPAMKSVVEELERIQDREIGHLHSGLSEEIGVVTLGSELFK